MIRLKGSRCDGATPFDVTIQDETILGRSRGSKVPLASLYISRQHCKLDKTDDQWFITDLKSFNGTYLNDKRLEPHQRTSIKLGNKIRMSFPVQGDICCFEFTIMAADSSIKSEDLVKEEVKEEKIEDVAGDDNKDKIEKSATGDIIQDNLIDSTQIDVKVKTEPIEKSEYYSQDDDVIMINSEDEEEFFPQQDRSQRRDSLDEEDEVKAIEREIREHIHASEARIKDEASSDVHQLDSPPIAVLTDDEDDVIMQKILPEKLEEEKDKRKSSSGESLENRDEQRKSPQPEKSESFKKIIQSRPAKSESKPSTSKSSASKPQSNRATKGKSDAPIDLMTDDSDSAEDTIRPKTVKKQSHGKSTSPNLMTDDESEPEETIRPKPIRKESIPKSKPKTTSPSSSSSAFSSKSSSSSVLSSKSSSLSKPRKYLPPLKKVDDDQGDDDDDDDDDDDLLIPVPRTLPTRRQSPKQSPKRTFAIGKVPIIDARPAPKGRSSVNPALSATLKNIRAKQESQKNEKSKEFLHNLKKHQLRNKLVRDSRASSSNKNKGGLKQQIAASFGNRIPIPGGGSAHITPSDSRSDVPSLSTTKGKTRVQHPPKGRPASDKQSLPDRINLSEGPGTFKRQSATVSQPNRPNRVTNLLESIIAAQKNTVTVKPATSMRTEDNEESDKVGHQAKDRASASSSKSTDKSAQKRTASETSNFKVPHAPKKVKVCDDDYDVSKVIADKRNKHENIPVSPMKPLGPPPTTLKKNAPIAAPTASVLQNQISLLPKEVCQRTSSADGLLLKLLDWKVQWMRESKTIKNKPPPVSDKPLVQPRTTYSTWKEYYDTYEPLILHEIWAHIMQAFEGDKPGNVTMVAVASYELSEKFLRIDGQTAVTQAIFKEQQYVSEGELILVELHADKGEKRVVFGYVQEMTSEDITDRTNISRYYKVPPGARILLKYVIRVKFRQLKLDQTILMKVRSIHYLRPMLRNIEALLSLKNSKLCEDILTPRLMTCQMAIPSSIELTTKDYNESQYKAILATTEAVQRPYSMPKMLLVQGPPGTGKTFTLIGMIKRLFEAWEDQKEPPKILVCAPSNGAIDEISRRLYNVRNFMDQTQWKRNLRLVRVGQPNQMHPTVRKLSLDVLVSDNLTRRVRDEQRSCLEKQNKLEEEVMMLDKLAADHRAKGEKDKANKCFSEIYQLEREIEFVKKEISSKKDLSADQKKKNLRVDILKKADVVLSTLNSCRQSLLEGLYHTDRDPCQFNCVIIDEASQCCEPEILMPLTYTSISKMILIGDPMQLPATVISPTAAEFGYGRSLFERLFKHFGGYKESSPVLMLDTQYRMHSEICHFPSLKFYDNRLKTPEELDQKPFPIKPYLIIDLKGTLFDQSNARNIVNELEADFVINLYAAIKDTVPANTTVGIITPYQGQKRLLTSKLEKIKATNTDVNTIDGFQGQERDIIILSLVRDFSHKENGIGFLGSSNRVNVALTRAKHSMIICVSDVSSVNNELWKSLLDDAMARKALVKTSCKFKVGLKNLISRQTK